MPDCYYLCSSDPELTGSNFRDAIDEADNEVGDGEKGGLTLKTDGARVYAFVRYGNRPAAVRRLGRIRRKLLDRGHQVHHDAVLEDFDELGLRSP